MLELDATICLTGNVEHGDLKQLFYKMSAASLNDQFTDLDLHQEDITFTLQTKRNELNDHIKSTVTKINSLFNDLNFLNIDKLPPAVAEGQQVTRRNVGFDFRYERAHHEEISNKLNKRSKASQKKEPRDNGYRNTHHCS